MECIYVIEGTLELGIGQELYHMEKYDFAIVFPELIHHYQVFDSRNCRAIYLLSSPSLTGGHLQTIQQLYPKNPVISTDHVHSDFPYALRSLLNISPKDNQAHVLWQAYTQIILAKSLSHFLLIEKSTVGSNDIIYRTVSYIAAHFHEDFSLTQIAESLGYSPYALSKVFHNTFHCNFNSYVNNIHLDYACSLLRYSVISQPHISLHFAYKIFHKK